MSEYYQELQVPCSMKEYIEKTIVAKVATIEQNIYSKLLKSITKTPSKFNFHLIWINLVKIKDIVFKVELWKALVVLLKSHFTVS